MRRLVLPQARRTLEVAAGETVLDAALAAGVDYPHGCRSGRCGSCKSRLVAGEVTLLEHSRFALSAEEKAEGLILACRAVPETDVSVAWLGDDDAAPAEPSRRFAAKVVAVDDATHDIKRIRLAPADGSTLAFAAGQYARLTFPGLPPRDYSMANRPGEAELEFHIRRVPGGSASEGVHATVRVGDALTVEGPFGHSHLRGAHAGPILCIAGGSGLAPIKSIVETALAHGMRQPIHVYFGARAERDLYLVDAFAALREAHANLHFIPVLSETAGAARAGFVTAAVGEDLPDLDGWKAYVAGPPAMVEAAMETAFARGLRRDDLHADVFFTPT